MDAVSSTFRAGPIPAATRTFRALTRGAARSCFPLFPTVRLHIGLHPLETAWGAQAEARLPMVQGTGPAADESSYRGDSESGECSRKSPRGIIPSESTATLQHLASVATEEARLSDEDSTPDGPRRPDACRATHPDDSLGSPPTSPARTEVFRHIELHLPDQLAGRIVRVSIPVCEIHHAKSPKHSWGTADHWSHGRNPSPRRARDCGGDHGCIIRGTPQSAAPEFPAHEISGARYDRLNRRLRNPRF
jgi:hypothetical protein